MLIGNGRLIDKIPMTFLGRDWNAQMQPAALVGCTSANNFGARTSLPDGYYNPHGWMLPRKGGNLSARLITGAGGVSSATAQSGYNIYADLTGDGGISNAPLGLIVSIAANLAAGGGISSASTQALASMVANLTGSSSMTATAQALADLGAALTGSSSVNAGNTALMAITASIRGYGDLTPEGIRDSVWNAVLAQYPISGTSGNALATASSGGVDLNALAVAVWEYATRTLTSGGGGATAGEVADAVRVELATELAQLTKVSKIHGVGVPLVVTATSRVAGDLSQTISTVSGTTTVSAA